MYATLTGSDTVELPYGVRCVDARLIEDDRGLSHALNDTAGLVLRAIDAHGRMRVDDIVQAVCEAFDVDRSVATPDVRALLIQLNELALVNIRGSLRARLSLAWLRDELWAVASGSLPTLPTRRVAPTLPRLAGVMLGRTAVPLCVGLTLTLVTVLLGSARFGAPDPHAVLTVSGPLVVLALFIVPAIGHEAAHLVAVRATGGVPLHVVAALGSARLVYTGPAGARARVVAAAGPMAGLACAAVTGAAASALHSRADVATLLPVVVTACAALPHLYSLLPVSADGRVIWTTP